MEELLVAFGLPDWLLSVAVLGGLVVGSIALYFVTGSFLLSSFSGVLVAAAGVTLGFLPFWLVLISALPSLLYIYSKILCCGSFEEEDKLSEGGNGKETEVKKVKVSLFGVPIVKK